MEFSEYLPVWDKLTPEQRARLSAGVMDRAVKKGTVLHRGGADCAGLLLVKSGQLRAYILSEEGREITLYRLFDMGPLPLFRLLRPPQHPIRYDRRGGKGYGVVDRFCRGLSGGHGGIGAPCQLYQRSHVGPVFRGHVAFGADPLEEP